MDEDRPFYQDTFDSNPSLSTLKTDYKDFKRSNNDELDLESSSTSTSNQTIDQVQKETGSEKNGSGFEEGKKDQVILEQHIPNLYDLSYACLLIPRFSSHYLMGDLADRLPGWMQQICISFGWRLEYLRIKPDYVQWILRVPPATSTAYFMRSIRRQTSLQIFEEFPRFKRENLSDDFWAPGYLIFFGSQPHPVEMVLQFIRQTRQQQGLPPNG